MKAFTRVVALGLAVASFGVVAAPPGPTQDEVGDADSFGRAVVYLGFAQAAAVSLETTCPPPPLPFGRCVPLNAQPGPTSFNETNLATMLIPGKSTNSLLCF